jgi:hypothetical protein
VSGAGRSSPAPSPMAVYLLFSGPLDRPHARRIRPTAFECEESARLAFVRLRLQSSSRSLWAHLVAIGADGKPKTLCWFGAPTSRADHLVGAAILLKDMNRLGTFARRPLRSRVAARTLTSRDETLGGSHRRTAKWRAWVVPGHDSTQGVFSAENADVR